MKKILLLSFLCLCVFAEMTAQQNLTKAQKEFQNTVVSFLREQGYVPSVNDGGYIEFRSEGQLHFISILSKEAPFFVIFRRSGFVWGGENGFGVVNSLLACNIVNRDVAVAKMYCEDDSVIISVEQYFHSAAEFNRVFAKNLEELGAAARKFLEEYYKLDSM